MAALAGSVPVAALAAWARGPVDPDYLVFSDRDLLRAAAWPDEPLGAELSYESGARVPGGGYALLLRGLTLAGDAPDEVARTVWLATLAAAVGLGVGVGRRAGALGAALTTAVVLASPALADGARALWNPTLLPPVLALTWALAAASRTPAAALGVGVGLGLATQLHLSALLAVPPLALALGRRAGPLAAGFAATFAGYAVHEAQHGFENTRRLLAGASGAGGAAPAASFAAHALRLVGPRPEAPPLLAAVGVGAAVLAGLSLVAALVRGGRLARAGTATVALTLAVATADGRIDPDLPGTGRYVLAAVPALAVTLGLTLGRRALGAALVAVLLAGLAQRPPRPTAPPWTAWSEKLATLEAAAAAEGVDLAALAATLTVHERRGDAWVRRRVDGIDDLLRRRGLVFPGSGAPCRALLLRGAEDGAPTFDRVALATAPGAPVPEVADHVLLGRHRLVVAAPAVGPCPTGLVQPYVATAAERAVEATPGPVDEAVVAAIDGAPGWVLHLDVPRGAPIAVGVRRPGRGRSWELVSRDLRGPRLAGVDHTAVHLADVALRAADGGLTPVAPRIGDPWAAAPLAGPWSSADPPVAVVGRLVLPDGSERPFDVKLPRNGTSP